MIVILLIYVTKADRVRLIVSDYCFLPERVVLLDPKWPQGHGQWMPQRKLEKYVADLQPYALLCLSYMLAL